MAGINSSAYRDYLVALFFEQKVITEVFLENSNQPAGTPDLTGVTVREVGSNYVVFAQPGSGGSSEMYVPIAKILLIEE